MLILLVILNEYYLIRNDERNISFETRCNVESNNGVLTNDFVTVGDT